jgi:hypothetical protein
MDAVSFKINPYTIAFSVVISTIVVLIICGIILTFNRLNVSIEEHRVDLTGCVKIGDAYDDKGRDGFKFNTIYRCGDSIYIR